MKQRLEFERHRHLPCPPASLGEHNDSYRFHLEDDIDGSGFFTLSEERAESDLPGAEVLEVEHAIDFDIFQARWLLQQVTEIKDGKKSRGPRLFLCGVEVTPPARFRVEEAEDGLIVIRHELASGRSLWASTTSVPAQITLGSATRDWFLRELDEILRIRGYAPLTPFATPVNLQ